MKKRYVDQIADRKKTKKKRPGLVVLLVALALIGTVVGGALFAANHLLSKMSRVDKTKELDTYVPRSQEDFEPDDGAGSDTMTPGDVAWTGVQSMSDPDVKNILLIGQDRRPGETGRTRSDSMIVCSINKKTGVITLVSLMRDMYVPIPGYTDNRINAAYVFGGMSLLDQVIEEDFGIVIDGNVEVDFNGFITAMSQIAPLNIELKANEASYLNRYNGWDLHEGVNALSAEQLLAYARIRHVGNADYERTERQRRVLNAAFSKLKTMGATDIYNMAYAVMPSLTTDLSNGDIMSYVSYLIASRPAMGGNYRLPVNGSFSDQIIWGMMVLVPDLKENAKMIQTYLYGTTVN